MKAWICSEPTGVEGLVWQDMPTPAPQPGEVRVAVRAASLNFPDQLVVQGRYQVRPPTPFVPGAEFSGVVEAVGDGARGIEVGQRVASIGVTGGFATHACVAAGQLLPLPAAVDLDDAAAFAFTYGTAHHALADRAGLRPGESVLVLGAAGGVGTAAIQVAKALGARVIAAAASADKCRRCTEIGADDTIDYAREDLRERLKALTGGRGVDVVVDPVGGPWAEPAFRSLAWRGRYLVVGFADGAIPALPWNLALLRGAAIVGVFWGSFVQREPQAFAAELEQLVRWYAEGRVKPVIDQRLPMSEIAQAYERMSKRQVVGKLLLVNPP
jgi:NADPH2:quinone reductase